jgi:hypothetical protein
LNYDTIDNHLAAAGSIERAAMPLGLYVAWCANLGLLSQTFADQHHALVMRVRYREVKGSELLVAVCGGELSPEHLNPAGRAFTESYYPRYLQDFRATFSGDIYQLEDNWHNYDEIAAVITRAYMGPASGRRSGASAGSEEKRWWQVWR